MYLNVTEKWLFTDMFTDSQCTHIPERYLVKFSDMIKNILSYLKTLDFLHVFGLKQLKGWSDGSAVKGACCSHREEGFGSQHPHGGLQPFITSFYMVRCPFLSSAATRNDCSASKPFKHMKAKQSNQKHPQQQTGTYWIVKVDMKNLDILS